MITNSINKIQPNNQKYYKIIKILSNNGFKLNNNRLYSSSNKNPQDNNSDNNKDNLNKDKDNNDKNDNKDQNNKYDKKKLKVKFGKLSLEQADIIKNSLIDHLGFRVGNPIGTEPSKSIIEGDPSNEMERLGYNNELRYFEKIVNSKRDHYIQGIRAILSFMQISSYRPIRNSSLVTPFILLLNKQVNYLFETNPFFIILGQGSFDELNSIEVYNEKYKTTPSPNIFNETEFLEESSKALKQIFNLAENEKSLELQKISCLPATPKLLLIRDVYYSIRHCEDLSFSIDDISIDNFEFQPIDCKVYCNDIQEKYLKVESTYKVVSSVYGRKCEQYPIIIKANWLTENREDSIDWKIFGLSMISDYDPQ